MLLPGTVLFAVPLHLWLAGLLLYVVFVPTFDGRQLPVRA